MMKSLEQSFGQILKEFRTHSGLSQETLALECDLDRSYISMLERGLKQPTISTLFKLSKPLGIKPSKFILLLEESYES